MDSWFSADAPPRHLAVSGIGANVGDDMTDNSTDPLLGEDDEERPESIRFSISVLPDLKTDLESIGWYWTERRKLRGRSGKWKLSTVCRRFLINQVKAFWEQMGIVGASPEERREALERRMDELKRAASDSKRRPPPKK